ncbi:hypothetical protein [Corticicoccus populi]|uniref:DUF2975 domain-containing protein n=1 Tax=Corticicoccus populi TaxID=1812821 RepID=A0ABW5WQI1_9STAP
MNIIRYIFIGIVFTFILFLGWNIFHSDNKIQMQILSHFINIDITIIGFLITLIGIIAALRNVKLVDDYMKDHGSNFKNILSVTISSGMLTIILVLLIISSIYACINIFLLIGILILQAIFFISCMFIIMNMLDMIFKKTDEPIDDKEVYK